MRRLPLLLLLFSFCAGFSQEEHAWVYFVDKENVSQALANPITILTQKAIDRKNLHGVTIDERDVPVTNSYVSTVAGQSGITVRARSKWFNCIHVLGTQSDINQLSSLSFVDRIEFADQSLNTSRVGAEALHKEKLDARIVYNYGNTTTQVQQIKVDKLHEADYTGTNMTVAVMDSGFPNVNTMNAFQRMRDNGQLLGGYDFVARSSDFGNAGLNSHGTLVLSTMAGFVQDQFVGTAPDANYYLFRTEDAGSETPVELSYWVEAAERADSLGVDVLNTSLGYNTFDDSRYDFSTSDMDGNTAFISKGAQVAFEKGLLVVTSAGNSGNGSWGIITAPADSAGSFTVGAVNSSGNYVSFSSRGPTADNRVKPDAMAMGSASAIITQNDAIATANGTSFSSPIMAGALACLWQSRPEMTNQQLMDFVRQSSSVFNNPTDQMGYGIPDLEMALNNVLSVNAIDQQTQDFQLYSNPVTSILQVRFPSGVASARLEIFDATGRTVRTIGDFTTSGADLGNLSSGLYFAILQSTETSKSFKFIKQ